MCGLMLACDPGPVPGNHGRGETGDPTSGSSTSGPASTTAPPSTTTATDPGDDTGSGSTSPNPVTTSSSSGEPPDSSSSTGPDQGLGTLAGECGLVDARELESPSPFTFENAIDFRDLGFDYDALTPGGQQVFDEGNLGGSSLHSEVIAFEVLARCEGATLLATEGNIAYLDDMGTKTDLLVEIDGLTVGVSVTRAVGFPLEEPYPEAQAEALLVDKLDDVLASTANVAPQDAWVKQILHVIAYADMHAEAIMSTYAGLPSSITADTIVVVTVTHGDDVFIY